MSRRATLTVHSRRLTPAEVCRLWFRRGTDFADKINTEYPDFPKPGPDGLFLLSAVEGWFDRFHGKKQRDLASNDEGEEIARVIRGIR